MSKIKRFIPNEQDNLHCLQSCFGMINHAILDEILSIEEAEALTNFKLGLPTWPFKAMLSFALKGLNVINIENFPIKLFLDNPESAIRLQFENEDVANKIISVSDFNSEVAILNQCLETGLVTFQERIPTLDDLKNLIADGYFLICNVNYWMLIEEPNKYDGHFIIVEEIGESALRIQNPGLPPIQNQIVSVENFLKAWYYPSEQAANIIAIK